MAGYSVILVSASERFGIMKRPVEFRESCYARDLRLQRGGIAEAEARGDYIIAERYRVTLRRLEAAYAEAMRPGDEKEKRTGSRPMGGGKRRARVSVKRDIRTGDAARDKLF